MESDIDSHNSSRIQSPVPKSNGACSKSDLEYNDLDISISCSLQVNITVNDMFYMLL